MYLENDMPRTFWQLKCFHRIRGTTGRVGVNNQVALLVVASRTAYDSDEALGIFIDGIIAILSTWLIPSVTVVEHLIIGFKEQFLVIVSEFIANLPPQGFELCLVTIVGLRAGVQPLRAVSRVMMDIHDAVHTLIDDIVHDFMHTLHPCLIHLAIGIHVVVPSDGDTDSAETGVLHHLHKFRLGLGLSPVSLRFQSL